MVSSPSLPTDLQKRVGTRAYSRLVQALIVDRLTDWVQEGKISETEVKLINQQLERGEDLAIEALNTHHHGKNAREGGNNLFVRFLLTSTFQPAYRVKLHPTRDAYEEGVQIPELLQEKLSGPLTKCIVTPI